MTALSEEIVMGACDVLSQYTFDVVCSDCRLNGNGKGVLLIKRGFKMVIGGEFSTVEIDGLG